MPGGAPGGGMGNLAKQLQQMQQDMVKAQAELAETTMDVTAGGGMVTVTVTGHQRIVAIKLNPEVVDPEDIEMLQDLLVAAVNAAIEQSQAVAAERLEGLTGGMNIPGLGL